MLNTLGTLTLKQQWVETEVVNNAIKRNETTLENSYTFNNDNDQQPALPTGAALINAVYYITGSIASNSSDIITLNNLLDNNLEKNLVLDIDNIYSIFINTTGNNLWIEKGFPSGTDSEFFLGRVNGEESVNIIRHELPFMVHNMVSGWSTKTLLDSEFKIINSGLDRQEYELGIVGSKNTIRQLPVTEALYDYRFYNQGEPDQQINDFSSPANTGTRGSGQFVDTSDFGWILGGAQFITADTGAAEPGVQLWNSGDASIFIVAAGKKNTNASIPKFLFHETGIAGDHSTFSLSSRFVSLNRSLNFLLTNSDNTIVVDNHLSTGEFFTADPHVVQHPHSVLLTYNSGTPEFKMYLDGVLDSTPPISASIDNIHPSAKYIGYAGVFSGSELAHITADISSIATWRKTLTANDAMLLHSFFRNELDNKRVYLEGRLQHQQFAYYKFNETNATDDATDELGNVSLTQSGDPELVTGAIGSARKIETRTDEFRDTNTIWTFFGDPFTINVWVQPIKDTGEHYFLSVWHEAGNDRSWRIGQNSGNWRVQSSSDGTSSNIRTAAVSSAVIQDEWQMLTVTVDASKVMTLTVNSSAGSGSDSVSLVDFTNKNGASIAMIAGEQSDPINDPDADIDELSFWNRVLSNEEITKLYNNGNGLEL